MEEEAQLFKDEYLVQFAAIADQSHFKLVADASVIKLGFQITQWEPPVTVLSVTPGGWAESVGLRPGDLVVSLNGELTETLEQDRMIELIARVRPLEFFLRRPAFTVVAEEGIKRLGFSVTQWAVPMRVKSVDPDGW